MHFGNHSWLNWSVLWMFISAGYTLLMLVKSGNLDYFPRAYMTALILFAPFFVTGWFIGTYVQYKASKSVKIAQGLILIALLVTAAYSWAILTMS